MAPAVEAGECSEVECQERSFSVGTMVAVTFSILLPNSEKVSCVSEFSAWKPLVRA